MVDDLADLIETEMAARRGEQAEHQRAQLLRRRQRA